MSDQPIDIIHSGTIRYENEAQVARITSILNVYHILPNEDPRQFQMPSDRVLSLTDVSPYQRTVTVPSDKDIELDFGWLEPEQVGCILLYNRNGMGGRPGSVPQRVETDTLPGLLVPEYNQRVPAKAHVMILPLNFTKMLVRAESETVRLEYIGIPK